MTQFKLYKVTYVDAGTEQYYCEDIVVSDDPEKLKDKYKYTETVQVGPLISYRKGIEEVEVAEFEIEGYKITVEKVDE